MLRVMVVVMVCVCVDISFLYDTFIFDWKVIKFLKDTQRKEKK